MSNPRQELSEEQEAARERIPLKLINILKALNLVDDIDTEISSKGKLWVDLIPGPDNIVIARCLSAFLRLGESDPAFWEAFVTDIEAVERRAGITEGTRFAVVLGNDPIADMSLDDVSVEYIVSLIKKMEALLISSTNQLFVPSKENKFKALPLSEDKVFDDKKSYFQLLGLSPHDASDEDFENKLKKTYRLLTLTYHPDKNKGDVATSEKFRLIKDAYEELIDPEKRNAYLADGFSQNPIDRLNAQAKINSEKRKSQFPIFKDFLKKLDIEIEAPDKIIHQSKMFGNVTLDYGIQPIVTEGNHAMLLALYYVEMYLYPNKTGRINSCYLDSGFSHGFLLKISNNTDLLDLVLYIQQVLSRELSLHVKQADIGRNKGRFQILKSDWDVENYVEVQRIKMNMAKKAAATSHVSASLSVAAAAAQSVSSANASRPLPKTPAAKSPVAAAPKFKASAASPSSQASAASPSQASVPPRSQVAAASSLSSSPVDDSVPVSPVDPAVLKRNISLELLKRLNISNDAVSYDEKNNSFQFKLTNENKKILLALHIAINYYFFALGKGYVSAQLSDPIRVFTLSNPVLQQEAVISSIIEASRLIDDVNLYIVNGYIHNSSLNESADGVHLIISKAVFSASKEVRRPFFANTNPPAAVAASEPVSQHASGARKK